jgi:hypothetical protein
MNEIGKLRTVIVKQVVRMADGSRKLVAVMEDRGLAPQTRTEPAEVWRQTRNELDGTFGCDRGRKLVVGLIAPDLLVLYPKGTRQKVTVPLSEVYRIALVRRANVLHMADMRERKIKKQQQRERRALANRDRRFSQSLRTANA